MADPRLQDRVPSCTACYFDLPDHLTPSPFGDAGYFVRFLNDQQWCVLWHLYVVPSGDHCVVASTRAFDDPSSGEDEETLAYADDQEVTVVCAPDFEAFLYRFWLENHIWFALEEGWPLTEEQREYLGHYALVK